MECDECGNHGLAELRFGAATLMECGLCGALHGDDATISRLLLEREAEERGVHPAIYPLVRALDGLPGLRVVRADGGSIEARSWPFVQLASQGDAEQVLLTLDNLTRSLVLSAVGHDIHWVVELEFQNAFVFTLKPRFHRQPEAIGPEQVAAARSDAGRLCSNLERDSRLSWWRSP